MLEMMWHCDACHMENVCDVSSETHFFAVILMAKRDHESISPSCEWGPMKIHGWLFHPNDPTPNPGSSHRRRVPQARLRVGGRRSVHASNKPVQAGYRPLSRRYVWQWEQIPQPLRREAQGVGLRNALDLSIPRPRGCGRLLPP